ncbi:siderophore ABC transporter substrate-binding protein [Salinicoccus albus]|uniref:siderophore ABC transporter substrate-binding protein n=1 Tax=Salinicoccus albus TaxID=418756 RepID=UPI00037B5BE8|nr:ABC transporter substrate-binding protein [Salinicoccus albus]
MEFKKLYLMITMAFVLVLAACGSGEESAETDTSGSEASSSEETVSYENDFEMGPPRGEDGETTQVNETMELPKNSDKVAVYDLGVASTFAALGLEENIVALPKGENNASLSEPLEVFESDEYANLGGLKPQEFETLAESQPEVIMVHGRQANTQTIEEMEAAAPDAQIVHVAADNNNYFQDIMDMTTFLGEMYDVQDEAEALVSDMQTKVDEVNQAVTEADEDMLFIQTNGGDLSFHGEGGRFGFLYEDLGFTSAGEQSEEEAETDTHGNQVSYEFIAESNPGVMLVMDRGAVAGGGDATPVDVMINDVTSGVDAVENENIIQLDPLAWYMNAGGYLTGMQQLEEVQQGVEELD